METRRAKAPLEPPLCDARHAMVRASRSSRPRASSRLDARVFVSSSRRGLDRGLESRAFARRAVPSSRRLTDLSDRLRSFPIAGYVRRPQRARRRARLRRRAHFCVVQRHVRGAYDTARERRDRATARDAIARQSPKWTRWG